MPSKLESHTCIFNFIDRHIGSEIIALVCCCLHLLTKAQRQTASKRFLAAEHGNQEIKKTNKNKTSAE